MPWLTIEWNYIADLIGNLNLKLPYTDQVPSGPMTRFSPISSQYFHYLFNNISVIRFWVAQYGFYVYLMKGLLGFSIKDLNRLKSPVKVSGLTSRRRLVIQWLRENSKRP